MANILKGLRVKGSDKAFHALTMRQHGRNSPGTSVLDRPRLARGGQIGMALHLRQVARLMLFLTFSISRATTSRYSIESSELRESTLLPEPILPHHNTP